MFRIDSVGVDYCFFVSTDSMDRSFVDDTRVLR